MPEVGLPHSFFWPNSEIAECCHCRVTFTMEEKGKELLTPDYKPNRWSPPIGFCKVKRSLWINRSPYNLDLRTYGFGIVPAGAIIWIGNKNTDHQIRAIAPQLHKLDHFKRKDTGTLIAPLTLDELILFTTHIGELFYADFVSHRS